MSAQAVGAAMMNGPDFEIDGLEAAEGSLDVGEIFIGPDGGNGVERFGLDVGTQDVDAVEQCFGIDLLGLALERQIRVGNGDVEVLGHFVMIDHRTDRECDFIPAAQCSFLAPNTGLNVKQFPLRGIEQIAPLACALVGQQRVATSHPALAGIIGRGDLGEIALVKERKLNGASLGEAADRRRAQGRDEVETGRFDGLLDASLRNHSAVADQQHATELEALLELGDLVRHRRGIADIASNTSTEGTPEVQRTTASKDLATSNTQASPPQQEPSAKPPPDAGGARTTNLLIGAVPTVPAGGFQKN